MQTYDIAKTEYKIADFLQWQRAGDLDLAPVFQRRSVWNAKAKSYLVDTVVRGLPTPIIFLRDRIDLQSFRPVREVVDGQQRLRTLISFINPEALPDFDSDRDEFSVIRTHNPELAGVPFRDFPSPLQHRILNYSFSTHVIPSSVEDREILMIFERLNSTGQKLTAQELRNAQWFGEFKTLMYRLALEQLERWRSWNVFTGDEIARMKEVELTSDVVITMLEGLGAKSQPRINRAYAEFDDEFPYANQATRRFEKVMDTIDDLLGKELRKTIFSREIWFVVLFVLVYERLYAGTDLTVRRSPQKVPPALGRRLLKAGEEVREASDLPPDVLDALRGASSDAKSRRVRLEFIKAAVG
jgi:Protein of unknown function DUF262